MGNLLFSPSGRIGPSEFMSGVNILVIIGLVLALLPVLSPALGMLGIVGLITLWCWVVLWVKRYHDAGKSGWMCLVPIIVWLVIGMILSFILSAMFVDPNYAAAIEEASSSGDFGGILKAAQGGGLTKTGLIVNAIAGAAVSYGVATIFNGMIKHEPNENRFGPA